MPKTPLVAEPQATALDMQHIEKLPAASRRNAFFA